MNYVPWNWGDWATATRLLSRVEKSIYLDLLELYYTSERPLMQEQCKRIANAMQEDEQKAFWYVLDLFFEFDGEVYRHRRADAEIEKYRSTSEGRKAAAKRRWERDSEQQKRGEHVAHASEVHMQNACNSNASAVQMQSKSNANQEPITNNHISTSNEVDVEREPRPAPRRKPAAPLNFYDLPDALSADWIRSRGSKKLTQTAIDGVKREAEKANLSFEQAVRMMLENGWQGFRASWDSVRSKYQQQSKPRHVSYDEIDYHEGINPDGTF